MHLNTAISAVMELVNELYAFCDRRGVKPGGRDDATSPVIDRPESRAALREAIEAVVLLLSPFTPHLSEELWSMLGHTGGVVAAGWPVSDPVAMMEDEVEIPVQVNGKLRGRVRMPVGAADEEVRAAALASPTVQAHLVGHQVVKTIVAGGRLVNIVVKPVKG
jgi:leucyl-tRNA synthetase